MRVIYRIYFMHIIVPLDLYLKKIKNKNNSTHFKLKI